MISQRHIQSLSITKKIKDYIDIRFLIWILKARFWAFKKNYTLRTLSQNEHYKNHGVIEKLI